jgi:hypothetical protein
MKVSLYKSSGGIGFTGDSVNMLIPLQAFMDGDIKVFGGVHHFQVVFMDIVDTDIWHVLVGNLQ